MKLKKLILQGFKSFADRTEFEIPDGITVIVGPNGCGKSNLVDAVKWVMGDQRPSSLRAKEMQDVIFSGTDSRRGMGFAEVSLVLDNPDRELPIDYEEVVLTRRLYRSGESEYQINGNSVRLRDVRELMMDAGGGLGSFSVIEQGNIDFLLRADPQERRVIFEEAAGIAKYRARRREAARKRERTAENLERLRGLISETETRERSLKIQAGKARRYREFTDELKRKRVTGALARYAELARRRDTADEELQAIARAEKEAREQLEQAMRATEDERRRLDALRRAVAEREAEIAGLMGEESAAEEKRAARLREADELALRADRAAGEAEEVHARSAASRSDLEEASGALARAERERDGVNEALRSAEQNLAVLGERARELTEQLEELDRRRAQSLSEETAARNEEITYEAEQRSLQSRLDRLGEKEISSQRALAEAKAARDEARLRLRKTEEELRSLEARHTAAEEEVRNAQDQKDAARESAAAATQLTAALDARREVLTRLVAEGEGLGPGARALLAAARAGALKGVRGLVADLVGDAGEQALTLDQALGDLAGAVVVETVDDARNALRWLQEGRRGRARILPLDRVPVPSTRDLPLPLDGLEPEARRIVGALLRGTTVVDTLQDALALEQEPGRRVVARSGEVVEACGALIGGSGEAGAGHLQRRAEIAELQSRLGTVRRGEAEAAQRLEEARKNTDRWQETLARLGPELQQARKRLQDEGARRAAADQEAAARSEDVALERAEREELQGLLDQCRRKVAQACAARAQVSTGRDTLEREREALRRGLEQAERARDEAASARIEVRVEAVRWIEKARAVGQRCAALEETIGVAEREAELRHAEEQECRRRREECLEEAATLERQSVERKEALRRHGAEQDARRRAADELQAALERGSGEMEQLRRAHERHREELETHRLRESEYRLKTEALLSQVRQEYGLDLAQLRGEDESPEEQDPEQLEAEIQELRQALEKLGNVNHAALEELGAVQERLQFLRDQEADLVVADRQLQQTIDRIDAICRDDFTKTFEAVRQNFREVFRKLFGGGRAEIMLQDPEDVLNSGVEIIVRPPGKELRNMALLSGGEKSMTTVALLFAIYQARPTPFCVLDEIDAALDESNTVRMCAMLKEYANTGQFLIITHARPTMTVADTLYGVTMPEAGVSRRVAVRFADIEAGRVIGLN